MELISIFVKICQALQDENGVLREISILLAHPVICGDSGLDATTLGPHQAQTCHGHTRTHLRLQLQSAVGFPPPQYSRIYEKLKFQNFVSK